MTCKDKLLIEIQSKFRKNIKGSGLIYMGLYDFINEERPITPERLKRFLRLYMLLYRLS